MPIAKSHSESDPNARKAKPCKVNGKVITNSEKYQKMEAIIDEVYASYINGETRTHILKKLQMGLYTSQDGKCYTQRTAEHIFDAAMQRIKNDMALKRDEAQAIILSRLESVYEDGISNYDRQAALRALDLMSKIYGLDKPQTSIQINADSDKCVTINFGFGEIENN